MDKYKEQLNKIAFAQETYQKIEDVGNKHNLNIDQLGELAAEIRDAVTGVHPAHRFTNNIQDRLEIEKGKAELISYDVDEEIFKSIKSMMLQELNQPTPASPVIHTPTPTPPPPATFPTAPASLNMIDFAVEKRPPSASPLYKDSALKKEDVLNDLENIEKLKPQNASNFIEHLLANPVSKPTQVEIKKPETAPVSPPPVENKPKSAVDPYREPV